jgi:hypothetical protein
MSHLLDRAADILDRVDFTLSTAADLARGGVSIGLVYSAAENISHASDLCSNSAGRVRDNEPRWRTFHERVSDVVSNTQPAAQDRPHAGSMTPAGRSQPRCRYRSH